MVPPVSSARASTVRSTGDSLPRSPLLLAAYSTSLRDPDVQSDTLIMSPHRARRGSLWTCSSCSTPGGHRCSSSGRASIEKNAELSRMSMGPRFPVPFLMVVRPEGSDGRRTERGRRTFKPATAVLASTRKDSVWSVLRGGWSCWRCS